MNIYIHVNMYTHVHVHVYIIVALHKFATALMHCILWHYTDKNRYWQTSERFLYNVVIYMYTRRLLSECVNKHNRLHVPNYTS